MIPVYFWPSKEAMDRLKPRSCYEEGELWEQTAAIVKDVRERGDAALLQYTKEFDGCALTADKLRVSREEIRRAYQELDESFLRVLREAQKNILDFHQRQIRQDWFVQEDDGSLVGQIYRPLDRVGMYVPGGTANYPSSVMMTALPARAAGGYRKL